MRYNTQVRIRMFPDDVPDMDPADTVVLFPSKAGPLCSRNIYIYIYIYIYISDRHHRALPKQGGPAL